MPNYGSYGGGNPWSQGWQTTGQNPYPHVYFPPIQGTISGTSGGGIRANIRQYGEQQNPNYPVYQSGPRAGELFEAATPGYDRLAQQYLDNVSRLSNSVNNAQNVKFGTGVDSRYTQLAREGANQIQTSFNNALRTNAYYNRDINQGFRWGSPMRYTSQSRTGANSWG